MGTTEGQALLNGRKLFEMQGIEEQGVCADLLQRPTSEYTRALMAAVPRLVTAY